MCLSNLKVCFHQTGKILTTRQATHQTTGQIQLVNALKLVDFVGGVARVVRAKFGIANRAFLGAASEFLKSQWIVDIACKLYGNLQDKQVHSY